MPAKVWRNGYRMLSIRGTNAFLISFSDSQNWLTLFLNPILQRRTKSTKQSHAYLLCDKYCKI